MANELTPPSVRFNIRMDPTSLRSAAHPTVSLAKALPDAQRTRVQRQFSSHESQPYVSLVRTSVSNSLVHVVQTLAQPPSAQIALEPPFACVGDEIALESRSRRRGCPLPGQGARRQCGRAQKASRFHAVCRLPAGADALDQHRLVQLQQVPSRARHYGNIPRPWRA